VFLSETMGQEGMKRFPIRQFIVLMNDVCMRAGRKKNEDCLCGWNEAIAWI